MKSNKSVKAMLAPLFEDVLGINKGSHPMYLDWCEFDGKLTVFNHWEEPYPIMEGIVSEIDGGFELGVVSLDSNGKIQAVSKGQGMELTIDDLNAISRAVRELDYQNKVSGVTVIDFTLPSHLQTGAPTPIGANEINKDAKITYSTAYIDNYDKIKITLRNQD